MKSEKITQVLLLTACPILFNSIEAVSEEKMKQPNIIFILADDLGYGDVSYLNDKGKIQTPNIDHIAKHGIVFTDAHSSSAVSTPTRYGVLTGRYNWRSSLKQGVLNPYGKPVIEQGRTTMASMLRSVGYHTACIGKWHLGMKYPTKDGKLPIDNQGGTNIAFDKQIQEGPLSFGFDYYFGVDVPNYPPYCFIEDTYLLGTPNVFYPANSAMDARKGRGKKDWNLELVLPALEEKAVDFIQSASKSEKPFFLYLPLTSPHTPIVPTSEFVNKSNLNLYADFVMQTDAVVGRIISALEASGIDENTIIVFTSDNGCSPRADFDFLQKQGHHPSYTFRGMKSDLFEGGHRVPCIIHWPKGAKSHTVSQTICLTDFMATFASLNNYKLKDNEAEDSYDILPLITKSKHRAVIREATVHHSADGSFAIRQGKWKLLLCSYSGGWSHPKKRQANTPIFQLYNLETDQGETNNLYKSEKVVAKRLKILLEKYIKEGRSTPGGIQRNSGIYPWKQLSFMHIK